MTTFRIEDREFFGKVFTAREADCPFCKIVNYEVWKNKKIIDTKKCRHFRSIQTGLNNKISEPDTNDYFIFAGKDKK